MPIIKILPHESLCPEGKTFEVPVGAQLCEAILKNDIALEHAVNVIRTQACIAQGFACNLNGAFYQRLNNGLELLGSHCFGNGFATFEFNAEEGGVFV